MVLDIVVVVSRTEHAVDEEDVAEIDKLLEVVGAATEEDIVGFGTETSVVNTFNENYFVIFSSVCVVVVVVESLEEENPLIFREPVWQGFAPESATSSGPSESPRTAMQDPIQAPSELQDRRDYTPADRAGPG
ncbi:hypothetical protein TNCV_732871 [Trichonephila clavipes]|nr:hypothetical protein TNCV_732871 [Trichonephila clavipes]